MSSDWFESDHRLIDVCSRATRMKQIPEEIQDHSIHPPNGNWLQRHANIRISTWRLRRLAAR